MISDLLFVFLAVVGGDSLVMGIMVLILNPRIGSSRIKKEILQDQAFIDSVLDLFLKKPEKYEPLLSKLQAKIQGTITSETNLKNIRDKLMSEAVSEGISEANPDIGIALDLISQWNPKLGKTLKKHPEMIPSLVSRYGKFIPGLSGLHLGGDDSGSSDGIEY